MSREFGSYMQGYFHQQIDWAAEDCKGGRDPLTKLWGEFLTEFSTIAYQIANSEACDSGPDAPIIATIENIGVLKRRLEEIEKYVQPYRRCMEQALRSMGKGGCA